MLITNITLSLDPDYFTYIPEIAYGGTQPQTVEDTHPETGLSAEDSLSDDALDRLDPDHDNLVDAQSGAAVDKTDADVFGAPYEADAKLGGTLREAFLSHGREEMGDAQASLDEVLSHMGTFPGPEDDALSRRLAEAAGLYGGGEGETNVSPAQTEYLRAQLLLALTDEVDWATELGTRAADGHEVTSDGTVLHGAGAMTIADAAKAARDRISGALQEKLDWAAPLADALVPVLIGDPTLSLPEPPETILYGSLEWAQLWIGMDYAEDAGLDPAALTTDELVALGRAATSVAPAADGEEAQSAAQGGETGDGEAKQDETAAAASYRATELLILIARARGEIDGASLTEENQADLKKTLADVAHDVFKEELAIAEALETLGRDAVSSRKDIVRQILRNHGLNPDQVVDYLGNLGQVVQQPTLAEAYFQHGDLYNILDFTPPSDLPDPAAAFDEVFEKSRDSVSEAMATLIDQSLALYAKQHGLNLEGATIAISRPLLVISKWHLDWGGLTNADIQTIPSDMAIWITVTFADSATDRQFFLSLAEPGKGLQEIPAGTSLENWEETNRYNLFDADLPAEQHEGNGKYDGNDYEYRKEEIAGGTAAEIKGALTDFYKSEIEKSRDHLRGETENEAISNFLLNLVPFRATIVAIQKGDVADAIGNGLFDILSFIPFVGEGIQAVKAGARVVSTGISTFVASALEDGLSVGLSAALHGAEPFGHAFGKQLLKTTVAGIESALPIPTPSLASHITVAGAKDIARVAEQLKATLPELANALEEAASRTRLVEIGLDGEQALASGVRVREDAKGIETIDITPQGAALDKIELMLGRNDGDEIVFLKERYNKEGERFYTLADPRTGQSYGTRLAAETLSPATAESPSPEFPPVNYLVKMIFPKSMRTEFPEDIINAGVETFNKVNPKITVKTYSLQDQKYIINNTNKETSGVCAAFVAHFLHTANEAYPAIPDKFGDFLVSLQKEYLETYRGRVSSKSLLYRRGLMTTDEITAYGDNAVSDIIDFFVKGRSSAYMAIRGRRGSGHALGLAWKNGKPVFFDPNWGVFEFKNIAELDTWVPEYIAKHYKNISVAFAYEVHKKAW
ncbi:YopT-type cysteine protease domain-containing protein [Chelativorans alearense]|uniref:YopT-type cysteine protease domain-containing protein n=1 Tax=Chelativorans alearense TaxID=2681495 RepID=UPI0013D25E93|nr:YopT-type cysteine protease domain-containing protein [Chelativorans alearense]